MLRQSFLCCDRSFFDSLTICLAKSVVLTFLCRDNLMCGSLNSYVAIDNFCCDNILFFSIFIMLRQSFLCCDRSFFDSLTICLAKSVVLTFLCRDNLMCGSLNSYVAIDNFCRDIVFVQLLQIGVATSFYVATAFLFWFLLQQCFLYC